MSFPSWFSPSLLAVPGILFILFAIFLVRSHKKNIERVNREAHEAVSGLQKKITGLEGEIQKNSAILHYMSEGVIGVDRHQRILIINPGAESILHLPASSAKGKTLLEVTHETETEALMTQALKTHLYQTCEIELTYPEPKVLRASAIGLPENVGALCGILVFYDITPLRKLENMRRDFVANVSHELRTPLTSISGFIETLLAGALKDPARSESFLKMMQEDTQRLTRLIQDLLNLSRIESREIPLNPEPLDLKQEIEKALENLQPRIEEKKINLQTTFPESPLKVLADADKLKQVLLNLLDNAIKFNPLQGQIKIHGTPIGRFVEISIKDTGLGIPPEARDRIFERFYRVDKSRTSDSGGTGLGLSIVKHIVEAHGGKVRCDSILGKTSTFFFTLPAAS